MLRHLVTTGVFRGGFPSLILIPTFLIRDVVSTPPLSWDQYGLLDVFGPDELNVGDLVKMAGRGVSEQVHQVLHIQGSLVTMSDGHQYDFARPGLKRLLMVWSGSTDDLLAELQMTLGRANTLRAASQFKPQYLGRAYLALLRLTIDAEPMLETTHVTARRFARLVSRWFEENKTSLWARGTQPPDIFVGRYDPGETWFGMRHAMWAELAAAARISSSYATYVADLHGFLVKRKVRSQTVGPLKQRCQIIDLLKLQEVLT
jgi:hypothetical protein